MIKFATLIGLLVGCSGVYDKHCDDGSKPPFPNIGGCLTNAAQGSAGGSCFGNSCNDGLQCVGGICYECGNAANPPEPCCGKQAFNDPGGCNPGGGNCVPDPDSGGWFWCVGGEVPPAGNCIDGVKPSFFVWTITSQCLATGPIGICAADAAAAQAFVDSTMSGVTHGAVAADPNSSAPQPFFACSSGANCPLSDSTESKATEFFAFDHDQVVKCEGNLAPPEDCAWADTPNDSCPASP